MTTDLMLSSIQEVSESFVLSKIQFLVDVHLWPDRQVLDPGSWLRNFNASERRHALNLLNVFLYVSDPLVDAIFRSAIQSLSASITANSISLSDAKAHWRSFLATVLITYVEGESPNPTDSGVLFARKARQVLSIDEGQIRSPIEALLELTRDPSIPILLVDDFVGGGSQICATWSRPYEIAPGRRASYLNAATSGASITYTPLIATSHGLDAISEKYPELRIFPAHILGAQYSLTDPQSMLWPDSLRSSADDFLYEASRRAGIVDDSEYGWKGYHDLSLPLAFSHSVPDSTLPLYFWENKGWAPLIRRT
jgi:hypothetical protein